MIKFRKSITLEAQKAITVLEKEQLEMMKELGLSHSEEIEESSMKPEIKKMTLSHVRTVWDKTNQRIMQSVDTYIDDLYEKERKRGT